MKMLKKHFQHWTYNFIEMNKSLIPDLGMVKPFP